MTIPLNSNRVRVPGRPLTANKLRKCTPQQAARLIRETRAAAAEAWRNGPNRALIRPVWIDIEPHYPNRRSLPDVAGIAPAFKAALDGLIDAGALEADGPAYVRAATFLTARIEHSDGNPSAWSPAGNSPNGGMILTLRGGDERCEACGR